MTNNWLDALLQSINADEVTMKIWKKEQDLFISTKKRMQIVPQQKEKEELKKIFISKFNEFCAHMKQIKAQFTELRVIKLNLLYSWIMIQLDFS